MIVDSVIAKVAALAVLEVPGVYALGGSVEPNPLSENTAAGQTIQTIRCCIDRLNPPSRRLLQGAHPPTAVIYANDPMAIAGIAVARERGLVLPGDLSIAGMDGTDMGCYTYPTLTTLDNDPAGWGRVAADALITLIEDGSAADVALPAAALIPRDSTSAPLARTSRSAAATPEHTHRPLPVCSHRHE